MSTHLQRVRELTQAMIRAEVARRVVTVGPGVRIYQAGRGGVVISRR